MKSSPIFDGEELSIKRLFQHLQVDFWYLVMTYGREFQVENKQLKINIRFQGNNYGSFPYFNPSILMSILSFEK